MSWRLTFARSARRSLRKLPLDDRRRLDRAFEEMRRNPLAGDVVALKSHPIGHRRRVGDCRILFDLDPSTRTVQVQDVLRRTTTTYRRR